MTNSNFSIATSTTCPGDSGRVMIDRANQSIGRCESCGGMVSIDGTSVPREILLSSSGASDLPAFDLPMESSFEGARYFDLRVRSNGGMLGVVILRSHGFFNPETRRVVQFG